MKNLIILGLLCGAPASAMGFSVCRNATNTVIYKTAQDFKELQVTKTVLGIQMLESLDLKKHNIELFNRVVLDSKVEENLQTITSSVKIRVTKNSGAPFENFYEDLTKDNLAVETTYICESKERLD